MREYVCVHIHGVGGEFYLPGPQLDTLRIEK